MLNDPRLPAYFWERILVKATTGCWLWQGSFAHGYGRFRCAPWRDRLVHRVAYEVLIGPVPEGRELDHLCRTPACCNPAHLEPVTHRVNLARGAYTGRKHPKTHCPKGHELTPENTVRWHFERKCRICENDRHRTQQAAVRAQRRAAGLYANPWYAHQKALP